jgi:predicted secreted protein
MRTGIMAAAAGLAVGGLALLAAGCNQPPSAKSEENVAQQPAAPDERFDSAVNFECEGGGKLDVVFNSGNTGPSALMRLDGGEAKTLAVDETAQSGMVFKDAATTLNFEGDTIQLTAGGATKACKFVSRSLPPPKVDGVVRDIKAEDAGAAVAIKVGEKVSVSLSGVPTAGYVWGADNPPDFVKVSEGPGGSTSTAQFLPGFAGGNHWQVLVIEALKPGEAEITLANKRPWETKADPSDERFKFKLKVE